MSDFVYDNTTLPTGKVDAAPLVGNAINAIVATEWNSVMQAITDTRSAIQAGKYHGLVSDPTAAVSPSTGVRLRNNAGVLEVSENAAAYERVTPLRLSAAPVAGTWTQGTIAWHSAPTANGVIGWVCTTAGTPGTWKEFGPIAP